MDNGRIEYLGGLLLITICFHRVVKDIEGETTCEKRCRCVAILVSTSRVTGKADLVFLNEPQTECSAKMPFCAKIHTLLQCCI